jgi:hypothetical protein
MCIERCTSRDRFMAVETQSFDDRDATNYMQSAISGRGAANV